MRSSSHLRPLLGSIVIIAVMAAASANTYQVSSDIQAAIDAAMPGDTIIVKPGSYGKIVVTKSLNLVGEGATIRAGDTDACIKVEADDVNISGFLVRDGLYGIYLDGVQGCVVANNTAVYAVRDGIALIYSDENVIKDNVASFNGLGIDGEDWYGIYLSNSNRNLIENNTASDNGEYGINLFPSCNENTIRGNRMERNDYGIYMFTGCSENLIEANRLVQNRNSGLKMIHGCVANQILNNTISDNDVVGIYLYEGSGDNLVKGNEICNNSRFGVQIQEGAGGSTIVGNNISGSQRGIYVDTDGNHIYNNRLFDNVIPAEDRGTNKWYAYPDGGNFWGDYLGEDTMGGPDQDTEGGDGFGDEPYWINEQVRDIYPLMGQPIIPLKIVDVGVTPGRAHIGDRVGVKVAFESRYGVAQVSARAYNVVDLSEQARYVRMAMAGDDMYEGTLETALMNVGRYEIVLTAKDVKGNEIQETIGEVELLPRSGWNMGS